MIDTALLPPQNLDAEREILGAILLDNQALPTARSIVDAHDFYRTSNQIIFRAMITLDDRNEAIDNITLVNELLSRNKLVEVGGAAYIAELLQCVCSAANIGFHCRVAREKSLRRALIQIGHELQRNGYDDSILSSHLLEKTEDQIFKLSNGTSDVGLKPAGAIAEETVADIERIGARDTNITGVPTGLFDLDEKTAGFQPGDLIIIAARPSMGKTSLAVRCAIHASLNCSLSVPFFSLEMSENQLMTRVLSDLTSIPIQRLRTGRLIGHERAILHEAANRVAKSRLFIDDASHLTVHRLRAEAKRHKVRHGLDLLIVDYLQLMSGGPNVDSKQQEIAEISRSLKLLAKELNAPLLVLSQLNRSVENRPEKRPVLSDLRESGAIEQDADVVLFIYRDEVYEPDSALKGIAEILIKKHRNGPIGDFKLAFDEHLSRFRNCGQIMTEVNLED